YLFFSSRGRHTRSDRDWSSDVCSSELKFNIGMPAGSPVASGLPFINVAGTLGFGGPTGEPQGRGDTTAVLNDTLSWLKGRHTFEIGRASCREGVLDTVDSRSER